MGTDVIKNHPVEDSISNCDSVTSANNYSSASTIQVNSVGLVGGAGKHSILSGTSSNQSSIYHRQLESHNSNASTSSRDGSAESLTSTSSIVVGHHAVQINAALKNDQFQSGLRNNATKNSDSVISDDISRKSDDQKSGDPEEEERNLLKYMPHHQLEPSMHCKGVINQLIDKDLIRTAIMEQDEDSLPRGIQQGYFKVRLISKLKN